MAGPDLANAHDANLVCNIFEITEEAKDAIHKVGSLLAPANGPGLDTILLYKQESMHYLIGYDTSGYPRVRRTKKCGEHCSAL